MLSIDELLEGWDKRFFSSDELDPDSINTYIRNKKGFWGPNETCKNYYKPIISYSFISTDTLYDHIVLSATYRYIYLGEAEQEDNIHRNAVSFTPRLFYPITKVNEDNALIIVGNIIIKFGIEEYYNTTLALLLWSDAVFMNYGLVDIRYGKYNRFSISNVLLRCYSLAYNPEFFSRELHINYIIIREFDQISEYHSNSYYTGNAVFYFKNQSENPNFYKYIYNFFDHTSFRSDLKPCFWIFSDKEKSDSQMNYDFSYIKYSDKLTVEENKNKYTISVPAFSDGWGGYEFVVSDYKDYYTLGMWLVVALSFYWAESHSVDKDKYDIVREFWPDFQKEDCDYYEEKKEFDNNLPQDNPNNVIAQSFDTPFETLNNLVGLGTIKTDVYKMINLMKMQVRRQKMGLKPVPVSNHLVFSGNPGTGKTTIARVLAEIYKEIGILSKGQLVEVDRSGLVAGYVGQTAIKTQKKIDEALGGILFIDEAFTLAKGGNDYGQEAIDTLLKAMEDHRDDFIVIVAGYSDLMHKFINSNPGLKSRFNKFFYFPDYTADELIAIFRSMCREYNYRLTEDANHLMEQKIRLMEKNKGENFANARDVRNLFEDVIIRQANRLAFDTTRDIEIITADDFL